MQRLIPEWQPSEAIILAWPDHKTDWLPWLNLVQETYTTLIAAINKAGARVILLCRSEQESIIKDLLLPNYKVLLIEADYNDTWVRDYAFLTCSSEHGPRPVEFTFNGWGEKFDASKDNLINQTALANLCKRPLLSYQIIAEGGALEINADGTLLSTSHCLLNSHRNPELSLAEYQATFTNALGSRRLISLSHGLLQGDDTDGHIDTLVRFTPDTGLVIQACENRPSDTHYLELSKMVEECRQFFSQYQIHLLPLPEIYSDDGERLPASYANYLVCNNTVLVPIYNVPEDKPALATIKEAYPKHSIKGIDCASLINQFGSLHCITMQVPVGTLKPQVINQFEEGVVVYAP